MTPQVFPKFGVSACVWQGDRVLIIQRAKPPMVGVWSIPGGAVEAGETALAAAHRELHEETRVTASLDHLVGIFDVIRRDGEGRVNFHYAIACYAGKWLAGEAEAASDALSVRWSMESELAGLTFTPNVRDAIARAKIMLAAAL